MNKNVEERIGNYLWRLKEKNINEWFKIKMENSGYIPSGLKLVRVGGG